MERDARNELQGLIFATSNLRYLRGLSVLPMGLWMALFPILGYVTRWNLMFAGVGLLFATVLMILAVRRINRYYDQRYGRVEVRKKNGFPEAGTAVWGAVLGVLVMQGE
jgi:hypothetical protein